MAATTARGGHHGQAVVAFGRGSLLLLAPLRFGACFGPRVLLRCVRVRSFWASFTVFFDPQGLKNIF